FRSFSIDPYNANVVYCGGNYSPDPIDYLRVRGFILKTEDGGEHWREILDTGNLVRWIRIDPSNTQIIYASTGLFDRLEYERQGILKSTDGGQTWKNINNGILNYAAVSGLVMHPENPNILYACTGKWSPFFDYAEDQHGAVYKTTDGGDNWVKVYEGVEGEGNTFTTLNINPANPEIVYATRDQFFAKSTDGGKTWTETRNGPPNENAGGTIDIEIHHENPETIYIDAYAGGVFKSEDGGETWRDASKGYSGAIVYDIALLNVNNPSYVITATHNGIYKSNDGGTTWEAYGGAGSTPGYLAVNPINSNEIMLGDRGDWAIRKSVDCGKTWYDVLGPFQLITRRLEDERMCNKIVYAPTNPNVVYAGFSIGGHEIELVQKKGPGVYKSINGGESWVSQNNGLENSYQNVMTLAVHPFNENIVYIGTLEDGVFKTTDGGENWVLKSNGLTATEVRALAIDPQNPEIIYAGGGEGVGIFKSTNGGELWEEINHGVNVVCPSYLLPIGRVKLGVSFETPKQFFPNSYTNSVPWTKITSIIIDPSNTNTIYASDLGTGVYSSTDGGRLWIPLNNGLAKRPISRLAISSDGKLLYAATSGAGVYRLTFVNYPPEVLLTNPNMDSTVSIIKGDSTRFEIIAYDLNADTLSYKWSLDGMLIEGIISSSFLLRTIDLELGFHSLSVYIADKDTSVSVTWKINVESPTGVEDEKLSELPKEFAIMQNYPNPFNPTTVINFSIPQTSFVTLRVFDILGREIQTLVSEEKLPGNYKVQFDGSNLSSVFIFIGCWQVTLCKQRNYYYLNNA
ncbi:MAG: hypothetical protein KKF98_03955, partial [Bacteroidetes bacterium]|nr:hypothetical protein [Bacteroidota bacterium]